MGRELVVEWKCDAVACGRVTWTSDWDTLPPGWLNWPGPTERFLCPNLAHPQHVNPTPSDREEQR